MPKCGRRNEGLPFEQFSGGVMREDFTNRNAPFGTQFTPVIRTKIVGGKAKYVTETQRSFQVPSQQSTQRQEAQVQVDFSQPRESAREKFSGGKHWQGHSVLPPIPSEQASSQKPPHISPTDKTTLPPIPANASNQPEREPLNINSGSNHPQRSAPVTSNNQLQSSNPEIISEIKKRDNSYYNPKNYDNSEVLRDYEWKPAAGYSYLPTQPINLSQDQEIFLLRKLAEDVAGCSLTQVRNVYQEMASHDHQLTGWGSYSQLGISLQKHGQELLQSNGTLDVERLRRAFSKADRSHRLTLSHNQIKDLCYQMNVPISEAVINQMISHCHSNGDGQYLWTDFISILEKVQPHATGLIMPQSKKPLEYAKKYLKPSENWPHPDDPSYERVEENSQSFQEIQPEPQRLVDKPSKAIPRALMTQQISAPAGFPNRVGPTELSQASPRGLGKQPKAQPWSKNQQDPWFEGFKKMAEALYRNDLDKKGSMKPEKCNWLVTEYNEIYDLQLPAEDVTRCIQLNTTTSGTVIDGLLQHLLAVRHN
ncbi:uncharacterized protein [Watersipora subatra]|uniref:uncharacterized protein n=1 Tax=Watersipora subatra TaxID=2589382 RepID=UPI00355C0945